MSFSNKVMLGLIGYKVLGHSIALPVNCQKLHNCKNCKNCKMHANRISNILLSSRVLKEQLRDSNWSQQLRIFCQVAALVLNMFSSLTRFVSLEKNFRISFFVQEKCCHQMGRVAKNKTCLNFCYLVLFMDCQSKEI